MAEVSTLTPLTKDKREAIIKDIMDWELDTHHSKRTARRRRRSSQQIASSHGVTSFQVGGIRSNLAAGRYGTVKNLRAKRRKERNASA